MSDMAAENEDEGMVVVVGGDMGSALCTCGYLGFSVYSGQSLMP